MEVLDLNRFGHNDWNISPQTDEIGIGAGVCWFEVIVENEEQPENLRLFQHTFGTHP